ncbi:hypothetical protein BH23CHL8_BH23CHL8_18950 [soil metagenome]
MTEPARPFRIGGKDPVERAYQGASEQEVRQQVEADRGQFMGMHARVLSTEREARRFRPDITHVRVVWEAPPWDGLGVRLVGVHPEVGWRTVPEAKLAIKELRLLKREMIAHKREETGNKTAARRAGNQGAVANYTVQAEGWERGILAVDGAIRELEYWQLRAT